MENYETYQTIILYKRNIPLQQTELYNHQFFTFGHFDSLEFLDKQNSLLNLWSDYLAKDINDRSSSSQPIFLTRSINWGLKDDFDDIENYEDYPFVFIALLNRNTNGLNLDSISENLITGQCKTDDANVKEWRDWVEEICNYLHQQQKDNYLFACYYPLTNSQCALRIHSKNFDVINYLLADLQRKINFIQYSFTIAGLNTSWIKDKNKMLIEESRISVSFDIVVNNPDYFYGLIHRLNEALIDETCKCTALEVIGSTDARLTYNNVSMSMLFKAYQDIIGPENVYYREGAASFISCWSCIMKEIEMVSVDDSDFKRIEPIYEVPDVPYIQHCHKALIKLVNTIEMLEKSHYVHYINTIIKAALRIALGIINDVKKLSDSDIQRFYISTEKFLQYTQDLLSSELRSEGQFIEAPGFNMLLDETPAKMLIAYHACLYEMRSVLTETDSSRRFAFLCYPKITKNMSSETLFILPEDSSRLFCIAIPEDDVCNIRRMLPQLVHEIGHCIGNKARNRKERFNYLVELISRILVFKLYPVESENFVYHIKNTIINIASLNMQDDRQRFHTHQLKKTLRIASEVVLTDEQIHRELWFMYTDNYEFRLSVNQNRGFLSKDQWYEMEDLEKQAIHRRFSMLTNFFTDMNSTKIVDFVTDLARECFADLIMVLLLKMNLSQYLLSFYDADIKAESLEDRLLFERINSVIRVLKDLKHWSDDNSTFMLTPDEKQYISVMLTKLEKEQDEYISDAIKKTIDIYLKLCWDSLLEQEYMNVSLITEKIYNLTCSGKYTNESKTVIEYIQLLLDSVVKEV